MNRLILILASTMIGAAAVPASAATEAATAPSTVQRYQSIRQFVAKSADSLWPGMSKAPFDILLVGGDDERLYCRKPIPSGFTATGVDPVTGCASATRPRSKLPAKLLAAMPVFGLPSTIVMGSPETTGRSDADWTRTILHEHFHQWQDGIPNVFPRIDKLDLAGDDQTGMWMLNFAFPYTDEKTAAAFADASKALAAAVDARGKPGFRSKFNAYLKARAALATAVGARNWRYADFELWKEGVARWTEIQLGKRFPDPAVRASAYALEKKSRDWLDSHDIAGAGREFVYPYGTEEAMLLEACGSSWRRTYPRELALGPMLERAARTCRR